jgi:hypothetical protein
VNARICPECGFDWERSAEEILADLRSVTPQFVLEDLRIARLRPTPETWSILEYTAHLRDALAFYEERIRRTLDEDRPHLEAFDFAEAADRLGYNEQSPSMTAAELDVRLHAITTLVAGLSETDWDRVAIGSDGDARTVRILARRAAHESVHHNHDLEAVRAALST